MKSKFLNINGAQIHYLEQGKGDTLILLPSYDITSKSFEQFGKMLAKKYHVIIPDLYKGKSKFTGIAHSFRDYARMLNKFVKRLKIKKFTLIGFSYSGAIAGRYAQMFPSNLKKLVLVSTTVIPFKLKIPILHLILGLMSVWFHNMLTINGIKTNLLWLVDSVGHLISHPKQYVAELPIPIRKRYDKIKYSPVKTIVYHASKDELIPLEIAKKMDKIKNLDVKIVDGYHAWFYHNPERFVKEVIDFVK